GVRRDSAALSITPAAPAAPDRKKPTAANTPPQRIASVATPGLWDGIPLGIRIVQKYGLDPIASVRHCCPKQRHLREEGVEFIGDFGGILPGSRIGWSARLHSAVQVQL